MASRSLTSAEADEARRVFGASIQTSRVEVSDGLGIGDAPYTTVGLWTYTIHLGKTGFANALDPRMRTTFIHEMTHVWQGQNSTFGFGFMVGSMVAQGKSIATTLSRDGAYHYTLGKDWTDYNCEQQASIVEDWYAGGMNPNSSAFRYIRDNIRAGKN